MLAVHAQTAAPPPPPIVWVQAGHESPREPGYRDQTGASSGPFGSEIGFTTRLATRVAGRLRAAGVDARRTPGSVTPLAARGAVFISLHHDAAGGRAGIGHAFTGLSENWYHGEGGGTPSSAPYADSAPHRAATLVTPAVEARSADLARRLASTFGRIHAPRLGARAPFGGIESREGNRRMTRFYGFYRTRAAARVILEAGAPPLDDPFLSRTDTVATAVSTAIVSHLRARGLLKPAARISRAR
jgi:N-acetylmuramoyl-L-alanine amidase